QTPRGGLVFQRRCQATKTQSRRQTPRGGLVLQRRYQATKTQPRWQTPGRSGGSFFSINIQKGDIPRGEPHKVGHPHDSSKENKRASVEDGKKGGQHVGSLGPSHYTITHPSCQTPTTGLVRNALRHRCTCSLDASALTRCDVNHSRLRYYCLARRRNADCKGEATDIKESLPQDMAAVPCFRSPGTWIHPCTGRRRFHSSYHRKPVHTQTRPFVSTWSPYNQPRRRLSPKATVNTRNARGRSCC
ncbi:unnamed protein product, partial [Ectocarpus sp. 13 AM-2016]